MCTSPDTFWFKFHLRHSCCVQKVFSKQIHLNRNVIVHCSYFLLTLISAHSDGHLFKRLLRTDYDIFSSSMNDSETLFNVETKNSTSILIWFLMYTAWSWNKVRWQLLNVWGPIMPGCLPCNQSFNHLLFN